MAEEFTEGWTAPIHYQLLRNDASFNAAGMQVDLEAYDREFNPITLTGITDWLDEATSTVEFLPAAGDLQIVNSLMHTRFKVTDGTGKISHFPRGLWEDWVIRR